MTADNTVLLQALDIRKSFPGVDAVRGLSLAVRRGTCFGLLGPNGAGKTTTLEIMEGILPPDSGDVLYKGALLGADFRQQAGVQFQSTALQDYLTAREHLSLFASFYDSATPVEALIETCALEEYADRDAKKLSGGQRQRLLLAIALVNDPEIVFLDEPTTGLDPQARRNFWELIRRIRAQDKTVVLTTHYMEEAYLLCDEIVIMDHGRVIAEGAPDDLLSEHYAEVVLELPDSLASTLASIDGLEVTVVPGLLRIATHDVNATLTALVAADVPLENLRIRPPGLEDLFLELTGRELRA